MATGEQSNWFKNGLFTGTAGVAATTSAIAAFGAAEQGSPFTPFNAVAHMFLGENSARVEGWSPKETLTGFGLHAGAVGAWGVLYEAAAGNIRLPASLASGALAAGAIYLLDYHVFPPRLRPGFEKRLGPASIPVTYGLLALALGLSPLWKRDGSK